MNEEASNLKAEIERLNSFITHLLENDRQLRAEITRLSNHDGKAENIDAYLTSEDRQLSSSTSHLTAEDGKAGIDTALFTQKPFRQALFNLLWREMKRCKWPAITHASQLLMHFYTRQINTHARLKSVTQMTESGVAKHLAMLKKRQLVQRTAFQEYSLTPKALGILREAARAVNETNKQ
jgi:uncharacterized phage infection (PIP) family protein YhgE